MPPFFQHLGRNEEASSLVDFDGQRGSRCTDSGEGQLGSDEGQQLSWRQVLQERGALGDGLQSRAGGLFQAPRIYPEMS